MLGVFAFLGPHVLHHLAFAVAMQFRAGFVLAMCGIIPRVEPIVRHDPGPAEGLGDEGQEDKAGEQAGMYGQCAHDRAKIEIQAGTGSKLIKIIFRGREA